MEAERAALDREIVVRGRPTAAELRTGLRIRRKLSPAGRRARWVVPLVVLLLVAAGLEPSSDSLTIDPAWPVTGVVYLMLVLFFLPWAQARAAHRRAAYAGEREAVVNDSGVTLTTVHTTGHHDWEMFSRWSETPELFVLCSADPAMACIILLPKRGLPGPDAAGEADRLRAVLDRHVG